MPSVNEQLSKDGKFRWGVDGSAYQIEDRMSSIDWKRAVAEGCQFMCWRMTVGSYYTDLSFISNMVAAAEAGMDIQGAYVVVRADNTFAGHMAIIEQMYRQLEKEFKGEAMPRLFIDDELHGSKIKVWNNKHTKYKWVYQKWSPTMINQRHTQIANEIYDMQDGEEAGYYTYPSFIAEWKGTVSQRSIVRRHKGLFWLAYYFRYWETALERDTMPFGIVPLEMYDSSREDLGIDIYQFGSELNHNGLGEALGGEADDFEISKAYEYSRSEV